MSRVCFLLALASAFVVSVAMGPSAGESTLYWWQKALFVATGGLMAMAALRLFAHAPKPQRSAVRREHPRA
jgi:hypothetical protein